jgi:hypothetical protein
MDLSPKIHHHIRWIPSGDVDWERHETRAQAQESAKQLLRRGEEYAIEQFDEACIQCAALQAGNALRQSAYRSTHGQGSNSYAQE